MTEGLKAMGSVFERCVEARGDVIVEKLRQQRVPDAAAGAGAGGAAAAAGAKPGVVKKSDPEYIKQLLGLLAASLSIHQQCFGNDVAMGRTLWKGTGTDTGTGTDGVCVPVYARYLSLPCVGFGVADRVGSHGDCPEQRHGPRRDACHSFGHHFAGAHGHAVRTGN
jgi:hypothetical protein